MPPSPQADLFQGDSVPRASGIALKHTNTPCQGSEVARLSEATKREQQGDALRKKTLLATVRKCRCRLRNFIDTKGYSEEKSIKSINEKSIKSINEKSIKSINEKSIKSINEKRV